MERLIESTGNLDIVNVEHFEFLFYLGDIGAGMGTGKRLSSDEKLVINNATLSIHHLLRSLEESGVNKKHLMIPGEIIRRC